jgi:hypothetical protein
VAVTHIGDLLQFDACGLQHTFAAVDQRPVYRT